MTAAKFFAEADGLPPIIGVEREISEDLSISTRVTIRQSPNLVVVNQWGRLGTGEVMLTRAEVRRIHEIVCADEFPEDAEAEAETAETLREDLYAKDVASMSDEDFNALFTAALKRQGDSNA